MINPWLFLTLAILCNSLANVLIKHAATVPSEGVAGLYLSWPFILGVLLFVTNLIFYTRALVTLPLSVSYPVLIGASLIGINLLAVIWFGEHLGTREYIGAALVVVGIVLLSS